MAKFRKDAKSVNFTQIFGGSGKTLGERMKTQYGFKVEDCYVIIKLLKLDNALQELILKQKDRGLIKMRLDHPSWTDKECYDEFVLNCNYTIVGTAFSQTFMSTYTGLRDRIKRENDFATKHGYVQCLKGPMRRLPELRFMKFSAKGALIGADKKLWSSYHNNLMNISSNTDAQTIEAFFAFSTWAIAEYMLRKYKFKSHCWNGTHDSMDYHASSDEESFVFALSKYIASRDFYPMTGINMDLDCESADIYSHEQRQKTFYKHGLAITCGTLEEELRKCRPDIDYITFLKDLDSMIPVENISSK